MPIFTLSLSKVKSIEVVKSLDIQEAIVSDHSWSGIVTDGTALSERVDNKMIFGVKCEQKRSVLGGWWCEADRYELAETMARIYAGDIPFHDTEIRTIADTALEIRGILG